jgi:hypothetical protein
MDRRSMGLDREGLGLDRDSLRRSVKPVSPGGPGSQDGTANGAGTNGAGANGHLGGTPAGAAAEDIPLDPDAT